MTNKTSNDENVVLRITYITSQSNTYPSAFVEYESFEENECEDE